MNEIYEIDEKTRIRRLDSMNWTVEIFVESKSKSGEVSMKWRNANLANGTGPFFGNLASAARWLAEQKACKAKKGTLKGFLAEYERIGAEIAGKIVGKG